MTMRDYILGVVAVYLFGFLTASVLSRRGNGNHQGKKNRPFARLMATIFEPIFWWMNLYGEDGQPSHAKVVYFIGFLFFLGMAVSFGAKQMASDTGMSWPFVGLVALVMAYALGKSTFNAMTHFLIGKFPHAQPHRASGTYVRPPGLEEGESIHDSRKKKEPEVPTNGE